MRKVDREGAWIARRVEGALPDKSPKSFRTRKAGESPEKSSGRPVRRPPTILARRGLYSKNTNYVSYLISEFIPIFTLLTYHLGNIEPQISSGGFSPQLVHD